MGALEKSVPFLYAFNMKTLNTITPYSDNDLTFDESLGMYLLTIQKVKSVYDNNFQDDQTLLKRIKKNSRKVYNFIYYRGFSANKKAITFLLNRTKEGREFILGVLLEQMEADLESGYNDLSSSPAVNISSGQVIEREHLAQNQVSVDTEQLIENSAYYFGVPITLRAPFPWRYFLVSEVNQ